jgi:hypothetical protein
MVYTEKQWKKISAQSFDTEQDNATICSPHFELHRHLHPLENISQFWCAYMDADMQISSIEELCGTIPEVDDSSEHRRSVHRI